MQESLKNCVLKHYKKQNALIQFAKTTSLFIYDCNKIMDNFVRSETASYNLIMNFKHRALTTTIKREHYCFLHSTHR